MIAAILHLHAVSLNYCFQRGTSQVSPESSFRRSARGSLCWIVWGIVFVHPRAIRAFQKFRCSLRSGCFSFMLRLFAAALLTPPRAVDSWSAGHRCSSPSLIRDISSAVWTGSGKNDRCWCFLRRSGGGPPHDDLRSVRMSNMKAIAVKARIGDDEFAYPNADPLCRGFCNLPTRIPSLTVTPSQRRVIPLTVDWHLLTLRLRRFP